MTSQTHWRDPVFIGGPSRSGTWMISRMLRNHPLVHISRETHYFEDLRPRIGGRTLDSLTSAERNRCLDYFCALAHRPYGKNGDPARGWLSRGTLLETAQACGDSIDSIFEAYCKLRAGHESPGAVIWGEKTPRNVFRIDDILTAFPDARIICMVRDPRAAVASYRDWQFHQGSWGDRESDPDFMAAVHADYRRAQLSYHIVISTLMWRAVVNSALAAEAKHTRERVRVIRYEEVIADPEAALRDICGWIGISYDPVMLTVPLSNSSGSASVHGAGVSREPMARWRGKLSDREVHIIQTIARREMERFGYTQQTVRRGLLDLPLAYASVPFVATRAAWVNRGRVSNVPAYAWRRLRAAMR